jgi:4-aminobutyrate aminotransferase-like enzyme
MTKSVLLRTGIRNDEDVGIEPVPVGGEGNYLILADGRKVIDAMTTPAPLGHRHPRVLKEVIHALETSPTIDEGWSTPEREQAAHDILSTAFAGEDSWVGAIRFAITGSEANDLALSLAQALTGRTPFVTRDNAYHGMVGLAREMTVQAQWHGGLTSSNGEVRPVPRSTEVRVLPFPKRSFGDGLTYSPEEAKGLLSKSQDQLDNAAAVIIDYTQGGRYAVPASQDELSEMARRAGTLWIADEVITGFGKGGRWFNFQRGQSRPDIVTLGKPMGGGIVPAAGVVVSKRVLDMIGDSSWQTYSALRSHPTAVAAARAFVQIVEEEQLVPRADMLHTQIAKGMAQLAERHPTLVDRIDGRGLHWWIDLKVDRNDTSTNRASLSALVSEGALRAGAMIATSGERNAVLISLSMLITDAEVRAVLNALDEGLTFASTSF